MAAHLVGYLLSAMGLTILIVWPVGGPGGLVRVSNASGTALATYVYDGMNRRIQKTIDDLSGGLGGLTGDIPAGTANYLYDGQQIAMERDGEGNWTQAYFWGQYIDESLFFSEPTETLPATYRVLSDLLYRSVAMVTTANVVTESYDTDAYGNTLCYSGPGTDGLWFTDDDVQTNNPINSTIFTGWQYDPESQIYYYRARYYSPASGRFISRDPIGVKGGINLYGYVMRNPINAMDAFGFCANGQVCCPTCDINITPDSLGGPNAKTTQDPIVALAGSVQAVSTLADNAASVPGLVNNAAEEVSPTTFRNADAIHFHLVSYPLFALSSFSVSH